MKVFRLMLQLANLMGLEGAGDKVELGLALNEAQFRIESVARYHRIADLETQNLIGQVINRIKAEGSNESVEEQAYYNIVEAALNGIDLGVNAKKLRKPQYLLSLENLHYLESFEQGDSWSCGYWSVFNASAIQFLLDPNYRQELIRDGINGEDGKVEVIPGAMENNLKLGNLDTQDISNIARLYFPLINRDVRRQLNDDEIGPLSRQIKLNNLFLVGKNAEGDGGIGENIFDTIWPLDILPRPRMVEGKDGEEKPDYSHIDFSDAAARRRITRKRDFFRNRKTDVDRARVDNAYILHFVCQLGRGHWILISIVKRVNRKPIMVILDSLNNDIDERARDYILFLYKTFINPNINIEFDDFGEVRVAGPSLPPVAARAAAIRGGKKEEKKTDGDKSQRCANAACSQNADKKCALCQKAFYCSLACQKAHWPEHKKACKPN